MALDLPTWGGRRPHSGRKPKGVRALVSHAARPRVGSATPVHVTVRMRSEIRDLRCKRTYRAIADVLRAAAGRFGMRVVHHSVQSSHIHLIVEAEDSQSLGRGMQGLSIRLAKRLNALCGGRKGKVLADRYHVRVLRTPREVRQALVYVLNNARKHAAQQGASYPPKWLDPYSSAFQLDGWVGTVASGGPPEDGPPPWLPPRTWLLRVGWRRHGLLPIAAVPTMASR